MIGTSSVGQLEMSAPKFEMPVAKQRKKEFTNTIDVTATLLIDHGNQLSTCELHIFNMYRTFCVCFLHVHHSSMEMVDVK